VVADVATATRPFHHAAPGRGSLTRPSLHVTMVHGHQAIQGSCEPRRLCKAHNASSGNATTRVGGESTSTFTTTIFPHDSGHTTGYPLMSDGRFVLRGVAANLCTHLSLRMPHASKNKVITAVGARFCCPSARPPY